MKADDRLLILLVLMTPLVCIGTDILSPSLPYIAAYFHISAFQAKISLVVFSLSFGLAQPFMGPITDRYGRRYFCLTGLVLTVLSCVLSVLSINITMLYASRILQGIAGSIVSVSIKGIIVDTYHDDKLAKASSYYSMGWALTPIAGPLIGAYLQAWFNWQASFIFIAVYAFVILIWSLITIRESVTPVKQNVRYWLSVYKEILSHPVFLVGVWFMSIECAILIIFYIDAPFIFQQTLGIKVQDFGKIMFLLGLVYLASNILNRILLQWFSMLKIILLGIIIGVFSSLLMLYLALFFKPTAILIILPIALLFLGDGLVFPNTMAICLMTFKKYSGTAGGVSGGLLTLLSALVAAIVSIFHAATLMPLAVSYSILTLSMPLLYFGIFRKAKIK